MSMLIVPLNGLPITCVLSIAILAHVLSDQTLERGARARVAGLRSPTAAERLNPCLGGDLSVLDGLGQRLVVAFVLVCVRLGEQGERAVEGVAVPR